MALCGDDHGKLISRVNRIEGQVRGIRRMIEEDRDCNQVLAQVAAAVGALRSLGLVVLEDHLKGCVAASLRTQSQEDSMISEVVDMVGKFTR